MNTTTSQSNTETRLSFFRSLRGQLILVFLAISLLPLIIVGTFTYTQAHDTLQAEIINKLIAVRDIKARQISNYFKERLADIRVLSNNPTVITAINAFEEAFHTQGIHINTVEIMNRYRSLYMGQPDRLDAGDGSAYSAVHAQYHPLFKEYRDAYHYYDIFLVEVHTGTILYSVNKEADFSTSLINGPYVNTNIGHAFQEMLKASHHDATLLEDFAYYEPSKEAAAFLASPIFNKKKLIGVLIFQLSIESIDAIMQEHTGLGDTGETLLVSSDDFLLRSNSRFIKEKTLFKQKMDNEATRAAEVGQIGVKTVDDDLGQSNLIAYMPLNIPDIHWSLIAKIDEAEAFVTLRKMLIWMFSIIGIGIILMVIIAYLFGNSLVKPIQRMTNIARQLANGNLNLVVETKNSKDEISLMSNAFQQMIVNLRKIVEDVALVSQGLIVGNLRITPQAEYQGDFSKIKTALQTALSNLQLVVEDIVQISQELLEGKQQVIAKAEYSGDFLPIKNSLETASVKLAETTIQNNTQNWLKTGQTQLNNQMSGEQEMVQLAKNIITFLSTYLEMPVGMFYLLEKTQDDEENTYLKLIASYAYTQRKGINSEFAIGEGLVGQAALEKKELIITKVPKDYYLQIRSGLGQALPNTVIVQPFMYEDTLKGVIELASFKTITDTQRDFLAQVMPNIGIAVNTAESRSSMQLLLQQSQTQAEELQSQAEELQSQQEELRQTNETLEERSNDLERQKEEIKNKNQSLEKSQTEMEKARTAIENKAQELELASKYKSEFLANMSHELRTPLNSLLILAQLLTNNKTGNLNEKQVEYAQTIHNSGSDLLRLINEILDLSKVEAGKIEVNKEDIVLGDLVANVDQKFRHVAQDKKLDFQIIVAENLPSTINTDGQRLIQIINNLLSNAFKFTKSGEVQLILQYPENKDDIVMTELEPNKTLAIRVTDSGIGIPKDKQMVIFEAFQQVDGTTSRRYGGTGLGLSISRQLAKLLGGTLTLHSEEGKGSTFTIYLPIQLSAKAENSQTDIVKSPTQKVISPAEVKAKVPATTVETQTSEVIPSDDVVADDRNNLTATDKSLLIIEDDRNFSKILLELAKEKDFKGIIAEDGKTGLLFAEQYCPNAIILDIGLPQLDGWTVMENLKDNPKTRHIPVHFMSASNHEKAAKKMGAIGYSLKPINMTEIGEAFKKIESFITKTTKKLLVLVDNKKHQQAILTIVESEEIQITTVATSTHALQELKLTQFDCMILDVDVEQQSGFKILEKRQSEKSFSQMPVIIYAERKLTPDEETRLQQYADDLTIKTARSPECLLDEATLFLHQVETRLSGDKQKILQMMHDREAIFAYKKVLIVDDDMRNSFALTTALEEKDMTIVIAENGKEALTKLEEHKDVSIVLMDIMMPEMDGYEAIEEIRKQPQFRQLPIIALTAKAMKGDRTKCLEVGANDYLAKPVDTNKLFSLIRVWLYK